MGPRLVMAMPMSTMHIPLEFPSLRASSAQYNHGCQFICSFSINYYLSLIFTSLLPSQLPPLYQEFTL